MNEEISGKEYAVLICRYIARRYANRGVVLYREGSLGKSIIGKDRRVDILVLHPPAAAYCLPEESNLENSNTKELDHVLAMAFGWWDVVVDDTKRFVFEASLAETLKGFELQPIVATKRRGPKRAAKIIADESLIKKSGDGA